MAEYIEREELKKVFSNEAVHCLTFQKTGEARGLIKAKEILSKLPSADVVEVRHGKWIKKEDGRYVCSECGRTRPYSNYAYAIENWVCNYCHYCGAKMDGKENNYEKNPNVV